MYTIRFRLLTLLLFFLASVSYSASGQDRLFTYTYQSNVLNKGQRELEVWNTVRLGKQDYFSRLDNRTEFEIGLGSNLQTSFYLNLTTKTKTEGEGEMKTTETENEISFSNEWKLKLLDPVAHPFGLALYAEYGIGSNEYEMEGKIILDKKIDKFTIAGNLTYEAEYAPVYTDGRMTYEKECLADYHLAFGYSLSPRFHLTQENNIRSVYFNRELEHSALYSGVGFSYLQDNFWINFTAMPQVTSFKGATDNNLNLNEFEKVQLRLLFSYAF